MLAAIDTAIETSLASADKATKLPLPSGFTVPVEAERVLKQAALTCYEVLRGRLQGRDGSTHCLAAEVQHQHQSQEIKINTMLAEMLRACVTQGISIPSEELGICYCNTAIGAGPLGLHVPPDCALNAF